MSKIVHYPNAEGFLEPMEVVLERNARDSGMTLTFENESTRLPIATVSPLAPYCYATVDTHTCGPGIVDFLQENGFGRLVDDDFRPEGKNPLFAFDPMRLQEADPAVFGEYQRFMGFSPELKPPDVLELKKEHHGGIDWYVNRDVVSDVSIGVVRDLRGQCPVIVWQNEAMNYCLESSHFKGQSGFPIFEEAVEYANKEIRQLSPDERGQFAIHELEGREGLYLVGEANENPVFATAFQPRDADIEHYVRFSLFSVGETGRVHILSDYYSDQFPSIQETISDGCMRTAGVKEQPLQFLAETDHIIENAAQFREVVGADPNQPIKEVLQQLKEQGCVEPAKVEPTIEELAAKAKDIAHEKNAERPDRDAGHKLHENTR